MTDSDLIAELYSTLQGAHDVENGISLLLEDLEEPGTIFFLASRLGELDSKAERAMHGLYGLLDIVCDRWRPAEFEGFSAKSITESESPGLVDLAIEQNRARRAVLRALAPNGGDGDA